MAEKKTKNSTGIQCSHLSRFVSFGAWQGRLVVSASWMLCHGRLGLGHRQRKMAVVRRGAGIRFSHAADGGWHEADCGFDREKCRRSRRERWQASVAAAVCVPAAGLQRSHADRGRPDGDLHGRRPRHKGGEDRKTGRERAKEVEPLQSRLRRRDLEPLAQHAF